MRNYLFLLFLFLPLSGFAQLVGFGYQSADFKTNQFAMNISVPYENIKSREGVLALGAGLDFTTSGAKISGLNVKPISFLAGTDGMIDPKKSTILLKLDAGYNFNFTHGHNGIILTPALYADYGFFYLSAGYDYNIIHNEGQVFLRVGIGLTWTLLKNFGP